MSGTPNDHHSTAIAETATFQEPLSKAKPTDTRRK